VSITGDITRDLKRPCNASLRGPRILAMVGKEPTVKVYKPQESLQLFDLRQRQERFDGGPMLVQGHDVLGVDPVAQEIHLGCCKNTLGRINLSISLEQSEELAQVV
jgi:hypothetical protein